MDDIGTSSDAGDATVTATPLSPAKARALSETPPTLSPSPKFYESPRSSKDDISLLPNLPQARRPPVSARGLSLQVPQTSRTGLNAPNPVKPVPLSPKLELSNPYGSPASVIPRRSRGLDFSRACTNLHHSTLADQSSPDSSPTLSGRATSISHRRSLQNSWTLHGSSSGQPHSLWSSTSNMERMGMSGSIGSVNMLDDDLDRSSSSDDQDELMDAPDAEDPILTTPHVQNHFRDTVWTKPALAFAHPQNAGPGGSWMGSYSPAARSLLNFRRTKSGRRHPRKESSSASASGSSSMPSPGAASPAAQKGPENTHGYFAKEWTSNDQVSRRASLTVGTKDLQLSSGGESDEGGTSVADTLQSGPGSKLVPGSTGGEEKRGVIKRAVTRRGNLLPKTKNFARIQAALMEEGAPIDSEVKREAEVIRQVFETDPDFSLSLQSPRAPQTAFAPTPSAIGALPPESFDHMFEDEMIRDDAFTNRMEKSQQPADFTSQAKRLSGGKEFWENFDPRSRTPPPPFFPRAGSLAVSDDVNMDSPIAMTPISTTPSQHTFYREPSLKSSRSSQSVAPHPSVEEMSQKIRKKRARDDDFDPLSFKRRAVSPGVSVHNSPILAESPVQKETGWWGLPISSHRDTSSGSNGRHAAGDRTNSVASSASGSVKRVGFHGMVDTNDGLQKMSIE